MAENKIGSLAIVATPIGNDRDITLRAMDVLGSVDAVICEEARPGSTLLKKIGIQKPLILLNEHNEDDAVPAIVLRILNGENMALISDCGTPVFADPGRALLQALEESGIRVTPVPGPASLTAAISVCKFDLQRFIFGGFLSRDGAERRRELANLGSSGVAIILMDTPYRLSALLEDVSAVFGRDHPIMLACDLSLPGELVVHGSAWEIKAHFSGRKCEFMLIISGRRGNSESRYPRGRSSKRRQ